MKITKFYFRVKATLLQKENLKVLLAVAGIAMMLGADPINTSTQKESGFEDGTIVPFTVCTTKQPNTGEATTFNGVKCMKFFWTETGYDGTRMRRGAEACSSLHMFKEGWYGFSFYLPSREYPEDKEAAIAQIFQAGHCNSWAALLIVRNKQLQLSYRHTCGDPTRVTIASDIQWNTWNPVIIHFVASHMDGGTMEVWYGNAAKTQGSPTYSAKAIGFGFGEWTDDTLRPGNQLTFKFGMYCYDAAHYSKGESRTLYFDNVCQLAADKLSSDGWKIVNPTKPNHDGGG